MLISSTSISSAGGNSRSPRAAVCFRADLFICRMRFRFRDLAHEDLNFALFSFF